MKAQVVNDCFHDGPILLQGKSLSTDEEPVVMSQINMEIY